MSKQCKIHVFIALFGVLFIHNIGAQTPMKWEDFVQNTYDEEPDLDPDTWDELYELHLHPINLNTATAEQLQRLPFVSMLQAESIVYYVAHHYPMRSLGELMLITEIDYATRMRLMLFCYAGSVSAADGGSLKDVLLRHPRHELMARTDIPLYVKAGYRDVPDSTLRLYPNRVYQGNNNYHSLRYRLEGSQHVLAGFQVEKDAGEKVFDYFSGWVELKNLGRLRTLVAGDYRVSFGQGLVVNMGGISFGKQSMLNSVSYTDRGLSRHSSLTESGYLRGIAADIRLAATLRLTAFASHQGIDGTRLGDGADTITSLKTDGLHRTLLERSKRGIEKATTWGGNLSLRTGGVGLGLTAVATHLSMPLLPKADTPATAYRRYSLNGTDMGAVGISYSYIGHHLNIGGETAVECQNGAIATNATVHYSPSGTTTMVVNLRHYAKDYATMYAHSAGEQAEPQNESGMLVGIKAEPWRHIHVDAYVDAFHFPYSTSTATGSSSGIEAFADMAYSPTDVSTFQFRYKIKSKQTDCVIGGTATDLYYATQQTLRLQYTFQPDSRFRSRSTASIVYRFNPDHDNETGFLIAENLSWSTLNGRLRADIMGAYFHTDSYAARLFVYEPSPLYAMGMTSFYYHGIRTALMVNATVGRGIHLAMKMGSTRYFDRHSIGTGLELINQSHREDLSLQLRCVF